MQKQHGNLKKTAAVLSAAVLCVCPLSGCDLLQPGLQEYTVPEDTGNIRNVTESTVDSLANADHPAAELDPDYMAEHGYDSSSFNSSIAEVESGLAATIASAADAESKYQYWSSVIDSIDMDALTEDFEAVKGALLEASETVAAENLQSLESYIAEYGMSEDDLDAFLEAAAKELAEGATVNEISEALKASSESTTASDSGETGTDSGTSD